MAAFRFALRLRVAAAAIPRIVPGSGTLAFRYTLPRLSPVTDKLNMFGFETFVMVNWPGVDTLLMFNKC